ncbi:hypothetical protein [Anaerobacillus alkalidiazotrophicus]|uniref:hypothetical protein n=1 Tax=Anaerobacillus alkalidiazotrophicus TaxID=472963 RepID=UPI001470FAA4|nr:hypothetical protein [Anaerobacillus alkalidiazotrophicus]
MNLKEINEFLISVLDQEDQDLLGDVVDELEPYELFQEIVERIDETVKEGVGLAFD